MTYYQREVIPAVLAEIGLLGTADPRLIEGWVRSGHSTLDGLTARQWRAEVEMAVQCIAAAGEEESIAVAESHGL